MANWGLTRKQVIMLIVLVFGTFVTVLNQTVVAPALPSIMSEMSVDAAVAQWLTTGFTLVNAIMIPVTAYLTDKHSTKMLYLVSMGIFAIGSLMAGIAPDFAVLLIGRLLQAAGAGILMPMVMTVLMLTFPVERRGSAMGIFGIVIAFAPAIGPSVSGLVIDSFGWRVLFYAIAILIAVVVLISVFVLKKTEPLNPAAQLDKISDEEFKERVTQISVYARVQPEHKARIVDAWKSRGNIVAMTGDGVNDAPSIKRADIGVGMGITGTDVTKNVADMVLADDNFATIINAVEEGRRIYDNIRKVIQFLLSANIAEVLSVFVATLIGFTIFQPVQLLWINLITDSLPALALGMEEAEGDIMKRKPRKASDGVFAGGMGVDIAFQGVIITLLVLASFFAGMYFHNGAIDFADLIDGIPDPEGVTMSFITLSMVEIFHSFNMRSRRASIFSMKRQNKWLWGAALLALALTVVPVEVDFMAEVFGFMTLDPMAVLTAIGLAFLIIPIMEVYKAIMRAVEKDA